MRRRRSIAVLAVASAVLVAATGCAPRTQALPDRPPALTLGTTAIDPAQVTRVPHAGKPQVESSSGGRPSVTFEGGRLRLHLDGASRPRTLSIGQFRTVSPGGTPVDGGDVVDCVTSSQCALERDDSGFTVSLRADAQAKAVIVRAVYGLDSDAASRLPPGSLEKLSIVWAADVRAPGS